MAIYYSKLTTEKITATKVKTNYETIKTNDGEALIAKGNYIVEYENGDKIGMVEQDLKNLYQPKNPKA